MAKIQESRFQKSSFSLQSQKRGGTEHFELWLGENSGQIYDVHQFDWNITLQKGKSPLWPIQEFQLHAYQAFWIYFLGEMFLFKWRSLFSLDARYSSRHPRLNIPSVVWSFKSISCKLGRRLNSQLRNKHNYTELIVPKLYFVITLPQMKLPQWWDTHGSILLLQRCLFLTSQKRQDPVFASFQVSTGEIKKIGPPRIYCGVEPSPDAKYILVTWLQRPYSYSVPCGRFPRVTQLWNRLVSFIFYISTIVRFFQKHLRYRVSYQQIG